METTLQWNDEKNELMIKERGISFDELAQAIHSGDVVDDIRHPLKDNQRFLLVWAQQYVWAVPYITLERGIFLKTAFKSRKYHKRYGHE